MYTTRFTYTPGLSMFAFPLNGDLATNWASRVECTGGTNGVYSVTVDETIDTDWAIFIGATQPSDFDKAKFEFSTKEAPSLAQIESSTILAKEASVVARGQVIGEPYTWTNQAGDTHTVTIDEAS